MLKVHIYPHFGGEDLGDGGIRRVVEAQHKYLPEYGIQLVEDPKRSDLIAAHIMYPEQLQIPTIIHSHGAYWAEYKWQAWAYKANAGLMESIRQADAVTAPSEWVAQALRRNTMREVTVLGHGVELAEWEPGENKGYVLWNKTRVDPVCDPAAVNGLAALVPDIEFVTTYGKATSNVHLTGCLPYIESKKLIRSAAVYLCNVRETMGIGTLEAMTCGVPVLGYRYGGQAEFIEHGVTGWLVRPPSADEPNNNRAYSELLEGLHYILANREEMGAACRKVIEERFQWKDAIKYYANFYGAVVEIHKTKMAGPRTSIIVTAYNLARYLSDCLTSVQNQIDNDWECIVVDDASPDHCGKIADSFALRDGRFKVIHNTENQYQAGARNTGIAAAKGRYILPLDADDMLAANTVNVLADELDKDRSIAIAYGNVLFVNEDGITPMNYGHVNGPGHSGWPVPFRFDWQLNGRMHNLLPYSSMYRREVWEVTRGYRTRLRNGDDPDFWCRAASYGFRPKMVTTADTLTYRVREDSMSISNPMSDWTAWYPWTRIKDITPAAAVTEEQVPISSCDPAVITVVIPCGPGHEKYLMDAVDSVDAQTFRQWECIVVNDTGRPLPYKLPSWCKLVETPGKIGVAAARNLGVVSSKAVLLLFLDADDYLEPEALEGMFAIWQKFGGYVYCDFWEIFEDGKKNIWASPEYDARQLTRKGCLHAVTSLMRRADFEAVGGFDENLPAWEDWDLQLKFADAGICGTRLPAPLLVYRKWTGMRREDNYVNFEASKQGILEKWGKLWKGGKELMACRSCPGGGGGKVSAGPKQAMIRSNGGKPTTEGEFMVVEYTGNKAGVIIYRGPVTGTPYRFGSLVPDNIKYVDKRDMTFFGNRPDFRVIESPPPKQEELVKVTGPALVAEGPPVR